MALWVPLAAVHRQAATWTCFPHWPDEGKGPTSAPLPVSAGGHQVRDVPSLQLCRMNLQDGEAWHCLCTGNAGSLGDEAPWGTPIAWTARFWEGGVWGSMLPEATGRGGNVSSRRAQVRVDGLVLGHCFSRWCEGMHLASFLWPVWDRGGVPAARTQMGQALLLASLLLASRP